jgi:GNAT superfamily N-acetyltransferase
MTLYRAPEPLNPGHCLSEFHNGRHSSLDDWLIRRARIAEGLSARTYVLTLSAAPTMVVGYHAIVSAMSERIALPSAKLRRDMPDPTPLILLGRLAVDEKHQGKGLGSNLITDAVARCVAAAQIIGARGVITHALDDEAAAFYRRHGFLDAPVSGRVLVLPMEAAKQLVTR